MIDLDEPTDFARKRAGLEEFLMAAVCVAGKSAHVQAGRLHRFLYESPTGREFGASAPFDKVRMMVFRRELHRELVRVGMGKYLLISTSFREMVRDLDLNLRKCPWQRLTEIPGIRPKTAKFFVLHSRPDQRLAVLDTHMHKKLKAEGYDPPAFPPANPFYYAFWQDVVLRLADAAGASPAAFDLASWREFRRPPPGSRRGPPAGRSGRPAGPRSRA